MKAPRILLNRTECLVLEKIAERNGAKGNWFCIRNKQDIHENVIDFYDVIYDRKRHREITLQYAVRRLIKETPQDILLGLSRKDSKIFENIKRLLDIY